MVALAVTMMLSASTITLAADPSLVRITETPGGLQLQIDDKPLATYVYDDPAISRPYFAHVRAPDGAAVTRSQPPVPGEDLVDHPTFHPGVWLAFGDLSGADDWRLLAPVKHIDFVEAPQGGPGLGTFAVRNRYFGNASSDAAICDELFRCEVRTVPLGYLMIWDSTLSSDREFSFGDQEEMGLGLRIATPLRAQRQAEGAIPAGNGEILDAEGRRNEREVWGNDADWCDYSGVVDGLRVGMTILCHPDNFRPSWFHARDRGLLVANPFGRAAFHKGEPSRVIVKPGESLRLRYGILVHSGPEDEKPDFAAVLRQYVELTREN